MIFSPKKMVIHCICFPYHVAVDISSGRNSMKANSRIIREINKPMLKAEKKWTKEGHINQCYFHLTSKLLNHQSYLLKFFLIQFQFPFLLDYCI